MHNPVFAERVHAVRQFTRFYTKELGILHERLLSSPYSLAESRVLYELAHRSKCTAKQLATELDLDPGYLSRIIARFARERLVRRERSTEDSRHIYLTLTKKGKSAFLPLNRASSKQVSGILHRLPETEQSRLVRAMAEVEHALSAHAKSQAEVTFRPHRPGDIGWVIQRHGALYSQEYGWDESFEALVAEIAAQFIKNFDPKRERCWIAELDCEPVGSVFLVRQSDEVAKLRLLLVEPQARGLGIGRRLVDDCIAFARAAGYRRMVLWTQNNLTAARNIYRRAGFRITDEKPQRSFGADLVSETWELDLHT